MALFQEAIVKKYIKQLDEENVDKAFLEFKTIYSESNIKIYKKIKEEAHQGEFIEDIFGKVLGYQRHVDIMREVKNETNAKKADAAILKEDNVVGVIELKDNKTKNLTDVQQQAFNYKLNHKNCSYVITSNFHKLRFYIDDTTDYEEFDLYNLDKESFRRFYLYLQREGLLERNLPKLLRQETKFHEEEISKSLYKDYSNFKRSFFENALKNNPQFEKLSLFKKSQKFLDRILFVLFAEDKGLVTTNSVVQIVEKWQALRDDAFDTPRPLYTLVLLFFNNLYLGKKDNKGTILIPEFGGELFAPDEALDQLTIDDDVLKDDLLKLSKYDFNTDVDVNILGHIFEHSLNEVDDVEAELRGETLEKSKSKRKKDGVFYTPKYITKYIVDSTLGKLCAEKKTELKLDEDIAIFDYQKSDGKLNEKGKDLFERLNSYKEWLLTLKVCDPACGSGAFLNQALSFFIEEHKFVDDIIAELTNSPLRLFDTDLQILENNIYGVDINEESIEIAKLSMWLRTAQPGRKLSNLSNYIKCGNSLIDDPEVAGDKTFNWEKEFPDVFNKGGFDVIIGNPPYVLCQPSNTPEHLLNSYKNFKVASYKIDLFHLFFEKSISLIKPSGELGFITPNTYLTNKYIQPLRNYILTSSSIQSVVSHEESVFPDASVDVATIILKKVCTEDNQIILSESKGGIIYDVGIKWQKEWSDDSNNIFNVKKGLSLNMDGTTQLGEICNSYFGIQAYDRKSSISETKIDETYLEIIDGGDIHPYTFAIPTKYFNFKDENIKSGGDWNVYNQDRIVIRQIGQTPIVGLCSKGILASNTLYSIYPKDTQYNLMYLLCILNSSLIKKYWLSKYSDGKQLFPKIKGYQLKELPIFTAGSEIQEKFQKMAIHRISLSKQFTIIDSTFIKFVKGKLTELDSKLSSWYGFDFTNFIQIIKKSKVKISISDEAEWMQYFNEQKKKALEIKSQIDQTDKEIDRMVYELYGLTDEEIQIVENN